MKAKYPPLFVFLRLKSVEPLWKPDSALSDQREGDAKLKTSRNKSTITTKPIESSLSRPSWLPLAESKAKTPKLPMVKLTFLTRSSPESLLPSSATPGGATVLALQIYAMVECLFFGSFLDLFTHQREHRRDHGDIVIKPAIDLFPIVSEILSSILLSAISILSQPKSPTLPTKSSQSSIGKIEGGNHTNASRILIGSSLFVVFIFGYNFSLKF